MHSQAIEPSPVILVLGFKALDFIHIGDKGIMDMEDFAVSNVLLPLGSLFYALFCTTRYGWGRDKYFAEVNTGKGMKLPKILKPYFKYVLPLIIIAVFIMSVI